MARERSRRPFSLAKLAKKLGVSLRQARRLWAEPRSQYEARSLARRKPWAAEGISRATWYRREARKRGAGQREGQDPDEPERQD
jgi:hypothetical protein